MRGPRPLHPERRSGRPHRHPRPIDLLQWIDDNDLSLADFTQKHLDTWLTGGRARLRKIASFLRWLIDRRLTGPLTIPTRPRGLPTKFLDSDDYDRQLRRCLNDDTLPIAVRISAALTRLYALQLVRIVELTTDRFHRDDDGTYLIIDRNPVLLTPKLARLIEQQAAHPQHLALLDQALDPQKPFLLPGKRPGHPRTDAGLNRLLNQHGFPVTGARNTAMIEAVTELPLIVISDLFGIHPSTAHAWANYAQDSWADYLAARELTAKKPGAAPSSQT